MRNLFRELKRAARAVWHGLMSQDEHTSHAEDTTTHITPWDIVHRNRNSDYIPRAAGQHRIGSPDSVDLTKILAQLKEDRVHRHEQDARRRAQVAMAALTHNTLHNTSTGFIPRITDDTHTSA